MRYREATQIMLKNEIYDRAVSSLYYSAFQTVTAYMLQRGIRSKSHTQVRSFVNNDLIRTGLLSVEFGKMYNKLMDMRNDADYSETVTFTKEHVEDLIRNVEQFNEFIRILI